MLLKNMLKKISIKNIYEIILYTVYIFCLFQFFQDNYKFIKLFAVAVIIDSWITNIAFDYQDKFNEKVFRFIEALTKVKK